MFEIARPQRYRLENPPLAQALVQVRFPVVAHFQELAGVAAIQDTLLDLFPYMEPQRLQQVSLAFGPAGIEPSASEARVTWKFTDDNGWTLTLEPGSATLFVGGDGYRGIENFADRFLHVLEALNKTGRVRRCDRLGVRYVNVVEALPDEERSWARWFRGELLGWVGAEILKADTHLQFSITQSQLSARPLGAFASMPADVQALVRHGVVPVQTDIALDGGSPQVLDRESYVLDLDLSVQAPQPFESGTLIKQFEALHAQIDAFFRWSLTETGAQHFKVVEQ